ncbi:hypothetical protein [Jeotgalibacillus sp. R-1-5s-1]|uniref:hypothetical protein n=1 Tax=Jeotgalibacillus sp. R-1-5s-1 TaxID=2555897 RepID=UPI00106B6E8A|nr:hypothetical protein [Jeotgalibacillus sp. R-1-5s-1]TFD99910.1 hypothetical protein E2491_05545 [Jeotgalibacillus sp. R-1-5s-1]
MRLRKKRVAGALFIICFLFIQFMYPYSVFSMNKEVSVKTENEEIEEFTEDLTEVKNQADTDYKAQIVKALEKKWITEKETTITRDHLEDLRNEIVRVREQLHQESAMIVEQNAAETQLIAFMQEDFLVYEAELNELLDQPWKTRGELKDRLTKLQQNLHTSVRKLKNL